MKADVCWTIVYRPKTCKVWTQWFGNDDDETPFWLNKRESAEERCRQLASEGYERELCNPDIIVPLEFRPAMVVVMEDSNQ